MAGPMTRHLGRASSALALVASPISSLALVGRAIAALAIVACANHPAAAHPEVQGALDVRVTGGAVQIRANVAAQEAIVANAMIADTAGPPATRDELWVQHGRYLVTHLRVFLDGQLLAGRLVSTHGPGTPAAPPGAPSDDPARPAVPPDRIVYELAYGPEGVAARIPSTLTIEQDVFKESTAPPGLRWEATFIARIESEERVVAVAVLLTPRDPIVQRLGPEPEAGPAHGVFFEYLRHGMAHILAGADHLLFVGALVLATVTLLDLIKIVTAFTLAHTITLTLAVLGLVRLPARVVEPMIAASIVYVALENVLRPERARRTGRLVVAFFFGLFHGLGFAGGLLAAMEGMRGVSVTLAILAFSIGVEMGHQMVALPLFALLRLAHRAQGADGARPSMILRGGSALISVAGLVYLFAALRAI